jgi:hypothetical protein
MRFSIAHRISHRVSDALLAYLTVIIDAQKNPDPIRGKPSIRHLIHTVVPAGNSS